mgnify:CR=1 FL=1
MDFDELTTQIRQALRNHIRYTDIPQDMPENEDMVNWILDGQKEGNAVAFATAAVMAYRAAGYPARYTEGYHLSDMDAQAASDAGEKGGHTYHKECTCLGRGLYCRSWLDAGRSCAGTVHRDLYRSAG